MQYIDGYLQELQDVWDYTSEELDHIKQVMALYAYNASTSNVVLKEVESIVLENEKTRSN